MSTQEQLKWSGNLTEKFHVTPDQIFHLFQDFGNFHKYHPFLDACYYVEGENALTGSTRYCGSMVGSEGEVKWCKEKLLETNPMEKSMKYEILDNNFGISSYEASIKVVENKEEGVGGEVEWSFVGGPVEGFTYEGYCGLLKAILRGVVDNMEKELQSN